MNSFVLYTPRRREWMLPRNYFPLQKILKKYVKDNMPGVNVIDGEGTYLLWLDFRATGIDADELDRRIIYDAKLWLDSGKIFGKTGTGFQRINVAVPRKTIEECMKRIEGILK